MIAFSIFQLKREPFRTLPESNDDNEIPLLFGKPANFDDVEENVESNHVAISPKSITTKRGPTASIQHLFKKDKNSQKKLVLYPNLNIQERYIHGIIKNVCQIKVKFVLQKYCGQKYMAY